MIPFPPLLINSTFVRSPLVGDRSGDESAASRPARALLKTMESLIGRLLVAIVLMLTIANQLTAQAGFGNAEKLNDDWFFSLSQQQVLSVAQLSENRDAWQPIDLPHDWSVEGALSADLASCTGYLPGGVGWYQKTLTIPADETLGDKIFLYFEGVYNRSEVYVNGHLIGKRPNGYISFMYDVTPYVEFDKPNSIVVRVDHSRSADSRWYTGSGIYRDVWLVRSEPLHLAQWGVFAHAKDVSPESATLVVETEIANETSEATKITLVQELLDANGKLVIKKSSETSVAVNSASNIKTELKVVSPILWNLDNPYLYRVRTTLISGDRIIDQSVTTTGFRHMEFDPDTGFSLNGINMKMKGVCLHHDAGVLGSAVPREVWEQRLQTLKSIGCNAVRTSHNPQSTDFYDICDEIGLLVLDEAFDEWEFPKRKWLKGWNVGEPGFQGSYDFFEEWGKQDLADMVRRDRNHPSIFAWSIGNEVDYPNDPYSHPILNGSAISQPMYGGYKPESPDANRLGIIAKELVSEVKKYDRSRPVTAALAGVVMSNETDYPGALDIVGYNYTENRYVSDHEQYPKRVLFGSENRHDFGAWKAVMENDFVFGQFLWTGVDYLGESGRWPSRGFYSGLIDFGGYIKPRGRFREALWSEDPVIYIGTMKAPEGDWQSMDAWPIWNYNEGESIRVLCYTNTAKAKLLLDGEPVGPVREYDAKTGIIHWDIPFESGLLEVVGLDASGGEVVRDAIATPGEAAQMKIVCDQTTISREGGLAMVELQIVDDQGIRVMDATHVVQCEIQGPARLLGLEASNNSDMSDYSDAEHAVFHGRILAYIKAENEAGEVVVSFKSEGLPLCAVSLSVE